MKHRALICIASIATLLVLFASQLEAQERAVFRKLTLKECIRIGIESSFDLKQTYAASQSAAAGLTAAFGSYLPSADITANYSRQITNLREQFSIVNGVPLVGNPLPNTYGLTGNVNLTLFNGFRREAQFDAARNIVDATLGDINANRLMTAYTITRNYIDVLRRQQVLQARRENLALSKAAYERVKSLYDNGRTPIQQVMSQETEVANQEVSVVQAENEVDIAKTRLLSSMSLNPSQQIDLDETAIPGEVTANQADGFRRTMGPEEVAVQRAFETRPDVLASRIRVQASESGIISARSGYWPTITANGGYTWRNFVLGDFDRQGQMYVGIFIRIPVFDQFVTNQNIQSASLTYTQRSMDLARLENQVRTDIRSAYLQLIAAEKGLEITTRAIAAATVNYDAVSQRFAVGAATLIDVQTANNQLVTARINRITAVYAYYDASAFVEFTTGMFGEK